MNACEDEPTPTGESPAAGRAARPHRRGRVQHAV